MDKKLLKNIVDKIMLDIKEEMEYDTSGGAETNGIFIQECVLKEIIIKNLKIL